MGQTTTAISARTPPREPERRHKPLRRHLVEGFVAITVVPLLCLGGVLFLAHQGRQRASAEAGLRDAASTTAAMVDEYVGDHVRAVDFFAAQSGQHIGDEARLRADLVDLRKLYPGFRQLESVAAKVPIIAMTANAFAEDRIQCLDAGMDDFATKPLQRKVLDDILQRWISPAT